VPGTGQNVGTPTGRAMLTTNIKLYLALTAGVCAILLLLLDSSIEEGTGVVIATLAGGAGWLIRDNLDEARRLRSICQAYAAVIETQFEEINAALSDSELERFLALAPFISAGTELESIGSRLPDPFAALPDIREQMHLLSPETTRLLWKWRVRATDLFFVYDELGTKRLSDLGQPRLAAYFDWIRRYRDEYRDIGFAALNSLSREVPSLTISLTAHARAGATDNALAGLD
jgi:hypothetical protein